MEIPNLIQKAAEVQQKDTAAALEVAQRMMLNFMAYIRYMEPHVPDTLLDEHIHIREDVEFAWCVCEDVTHAA